MPSIKMAGKSKEDLVAIAQIAGLLTKSQAQRMTKAKLIDFLEQEDARAASATHEKVNPPSRRNPKASRRPHSPTARLRNRSNRHRPNSLQSLKSRPRRCDAGHLPGRRRKPGGQTASS